VIDSPARPLSTIRRQLGWLVAATAVPAVMAGAVLGAYSYERQRSIIEERTLETARALVQVVDRQLAASQVAVKLLAKSPHLASGDLAAFHRQAVEALPDVSGTNFVLIDSSGRQVLNTLRPFGDPLDSETELRMAHVRQVFATRRPATSDLFIGAVTGKPVIAVDAPVFRNGRVVYDLAMGVSPDRLGEILALQQVPEGWVASIFDSQGTIVARTHDPATYVGKKAVLPLLQRMSLSREGHVEMPTLEGIPVMAVFSHSTLSNWAVAIGIPTRVLAAYLWKPIALVAGGAFAILVCGLGIAHWISKPISHSFRALVGPATALGRGEEPIVPPLPLEEAEEVGQALVRTSQVLRQREGVLAVVAHDLRGPLSALVLGTKLAQHRARKLADGEKLADQLGTLRDVAHDMSGLVEDLLAVAVSANDKRSLLALAPVDASALLTRAANAVRPLFADAGIELRLEIGDQALPTVCADAKRVLRVFMNLLDNARKFTDAGGEVLLRAQPRPDAVRFSVANTGAALPSEQLDTMFRTFWQSDVEDRRGAGLGLSICRSIVEMHGGRIWPEPEPGKRVRICFELPRDATACSRAGEAAGSDAAIGQAHPAHVAL
jgi:signal transduction histidine kinase